MTRRTVNRTPYAAIPPCVRRKYPLIKSGKNSCKYKYVSESISVQNVTAYPVQVYATSAKTGRKGFVHLGVFSDVQTAAFALAYCMEHGVIQSHDKLAGPHIASCIDRLTQRDVPPAPPAPQQCSYEHFLPDCMYF